MPPVHPRVCGEHTGAGNVAASTVGSSPRMRGTPSTRQKERAEFRFIPAYAGNTPRRDQRIRYRPVHPRVCGEHRNSRVRRATWRGSSPRMRGTLGESKFTRTDCRFIPAYAGNTLPYGIPMTGMTVHPRVCGEHGKPPRNWRMKTGSSPRMRGTLDFSAAGPRIVWFIPAYAGNTIRVTPFTPMKPVHPRVCGEHRRASQAKPVCIPSSPRMRGTQSLCAEYIVSVRFIPAYAGNTACAAS